jgi:hypothetical protein
LATSSAEAYEALDGFGATECFLDISKVTEQTFEVLAWLF